MPATPKKLGDRLDRIDQKATAAVNRTVSITETNVPVGTVLMYTASAPPSGFLLCNGAAVNRNTYSALFGLIGTTYGAGDGSTTFNLPDLHQSFPRGNNTGPGGTGGSDSHHHGLTGATAAITFDGTNLDSKLPATATPFTSNNRKAVAGAVSNPATNTVSSTSLIGNTDNNDPATSTSLPPYIDLLFVIKF